MATLMRTAAVILLASLVGCATGNPNAFQRFPGMAGLFGSGSYNPSVPVYTGEVPQDYTYKDLGPVDWKCAAHPDMGSAASYANQACEQIAAKAKAMGANAIIKANIAWQTCECSGEAVSFNSMPKE